VNLLHAFVRGVGSEVDAVTYADQAEALAIRDATRMDQNGVVEAGH